MDRFSHEEEYHKKTRKELRHLRKLSSAKDRSKYKKTDRDQKKKGEKKRPIEEGEEEGRVLQIGSEGITVQTPTGNFITKLKGTLKKERGEKKNLVAVGDRVFIQGNTITHIEKRTSILSRTDNLIRQKEQILAANVDQVLITTSLEEPSLKPLLIDRYLIAAQKGNLTPLIIINKIDLMNDENREHFEKVLATYRALSIPVFPISLKTHEGIEELQRAMQGKTSVFSGQSGVGKTSLMNAFLGSDFTTQEVVKRTAKGSHTTTQARLLPLPAGGFLIDTPGIKSFGIWGLELSEVKHYFPEIAKLGQQCKFSSCTHQEEPGCAVRKGAQEEIISPLRFASYLALMSELSSEYKRR